MNRLRPAVMILAVSAIGVSAASVANAADTTAPKSVTSASATVAPNVAPVPSATVAAAPAPAPIADAPAAPISQAPAAPISQAPAASATESTDSDLSKLGVRPARPLALAPVRESSDVGTKLAVMVVIAGVGFAFWRKRKSGGKVQGKSQTHTLNVTARARVGLRAEIVIVEVDGQSILLGVTPQSIQTLTTLSDVADVAETRELSNLSENSGNSREAMHEAEFGSRLTSLVRATGREDRVTTRGSSTRIMSHIDDANDEEEEVRPRAAASTRIEKERMVPRRRHDEAQVVGLKRRSGTP